MKVVEITTVGSLASFVRRARLEPVVVLSAGRPVAAVVTLHNADKETATLATNAEFLALIERSRAQQRVRRGLSPADVRKRLGLSVTPKPKSRKTRSRRTLSSK
jgi:hypothetical protein